MLRNREERTAIKLHGVNLAVESSKLELGWFDQLTNWIPAREELSSICKKRGVVALEDTFGGEEGEGLEIVVPTGCEQE